MVNTKSNELKYCDMELCTTSPIRALLQSEVVHRIECSAFVHDVRRVEFSYARRWYAIVEDKFSSAW